MLTTVVDPVYSDDFSALVAPLSPPVAALTARLTALVAAHPGLRGKVMNGWKSINFRHGEAGHICSVFPRQDRVLLYFEHGRQLEEAKSLLQGDGLKRGRYLQLGPDAEIPVDLIGILLSQTIALLD